MEWSASTRSLEEGRRFLLEIARSARIVIVFHGDVDGLIAAVVADLGVDAPFPETKAMLKKCGRRNITEAVSISMRQNDRRRTM